MRASRHRLLRDEAGAIVPRLFGGVQPNDIIPYSASVYPLCVPRFGTLTSVTVALPSATT